MLGYMITWTTYGTWLQGDERGYAKDGAILPANEKLEESNSQLQVRDAVYISEAQQRAVREAILKEAATRCQKIYAISVEATHVHVVVGQTGEPIDKMVAYYKTAARLALQEKGHTGRLWTRGYDKRFCFDDASLTARIEYVKSHNHPANPR
jgi:hypothetical protein